MTEALLPAVASLALQLQPVEGRPFARVDGPVAARAASPCELVAMDAAGRELGRARVGAGEVDLAAALPAIRSAPRAVRVQALRDGVPVDAPLVVTPLEVRPTIRTMPDLRPDGKTRFTRIIGWGDRLLDPSNPAHAEAARGWEKSDPAPRSGFRVDLDRDVAFETTAGRIRFAMRPDAAPATALNFVALAASGFYDGTIVHRVVPKGRGGRPFVIQGGDPTGTGDGGPGYDIMLEPSDLPHDFGVVSMARNDWPDSAGSQWFVALTREETARLDGQYCAFGEAVEGADAILAIERGEIADESTGRPRAPVTVTRATVQPARPWVPGSGRPEPRVSRPGTTR
jgi:peptidyl-prolyl cis-trans isomerase B (cyclophilin B)